MRNFLIDTDTASDDAVAIIMALAEPKRPRARTDDGRRQCGPRAGDPERAADRRGLNSEVPVFAGADKPLNRAHDHAHWFHGKDGLGDRGYPKAKTQA